MRRLQSIAAVMITVAGCVASRPTTKAQVVGITMSRDAVKNCLPLGIVEASDDVSGGATVAQTPLESGASRRLRAEAARMGANTVLLPENPSSANSGTSMRGEAYKCARVE